MKITDYSGIAERYDKNPVRHQIPKDRNIEEILASRGGTVTVLDLACGTGNYLTRQIGEYPDARIRWMGLDQSPRMLEVARSKGLAVDFTTGDAAHLPYDSGSIDYIKNRFAFHHITEKRKVIDEIYRVLKPEGIVSLYNICPEYMRSPWMDTYFPQTTVYDRERFPETRELYRWFDEQGFQTSLEIKTRIKKISYEDILFEVRNRDMSQLNLISEDEYRQGLEKLIRDSRKETHYIGDISFMEIVGKKI